MCILIEHDKGTRFVARYHQHQVIIGQANGDDPEDSMSPGRLFLATLGACAGLYAVRFCQRHDIPYQGLTIRVDDQSAESPPRVAAAQISLTFPQPIPDKYRGAVLRAADQCYVKHH